jgi:hypothetical protein
MLTCMTVHPSAVVALTVLAPGGAHSSWILAAALISGASMPPITVCVRALYPRLVADASLQRTAYSLDSAIIEAVFVLGPALAAGFAAVGLQVGALWLSAACALGGGLLFLDAGAVRAWRTRHENPRSADGKSALWNRRLAGLIAAAALFAFAFGAFEIGVVGFAAGNGAPAAAGLILALASFGSVLGVLAYGGRSWSLDSGKQFLMLLGLMAGGLAGLVPIRSLELFAAAVIVAAAPMAPVIAANSVLIAKVAPRDRVAETFTWASTALLAGISAGTATGGALVEHFSPAAALLAASAATVLAAAVAYPATRRLVPGAGEPHR